MTQPTNQGNTPQRFVAGAIDLGEVKARAEARAQAEEQAAKRERMKAAGYDPAADISTSVEVTMDNVEEEVLRRSQQVPVVVQVGSSRAPESDELRANLTQLAAIADRSWIFAYIDADSTPELAQMLGMQAVPSVVALAGARPLADFQGNQPVDALQQWTTAVVQATAGKLSGLPGLEDAPAAEDPRFAPATEATERGDFAAAEKVYLDILAQEPANKEAKAALDNVRFAARLAQHEGDDAVGAAAANPGDVDLACAAADQEIAQGQVEQAFDRLIQLLANPDTKAAAKDRLLELFGMFDPADPRVAAARRKMASALF